MGRTHEYLPHASVSRPVETRHNVARAFNPAKRSPCRNKWNVWWPRMIPLNYGQLAENNVVDFHVCVYSDCWDSTSFISVSILWFDWPLCTVYENVNLDTTRPVLYPQTVRDWKQWSAASTGVAAGSPALRISQQWTSPPVPCGARGHGSWFWFCATCAFRKRELTLLTLVWSHKCKVAFWKNRW
jgi:hypothetical protein